jgi:Fe-S cluster assembly ATP-binding protein
MKFQEISITIDDKQLLKNFSKTIAPGETVVVIGPNGCGKSTFAHGIMGRSDIVVEGSMQLNGKEITDMETNERSQEGLFVSWQTPPELPGVSTFGLIKEIKKIKSKDIGTELKEFKKILTTVGLPETWTTRPVNVGGSGGERKRAELTNLLTLKPQFAILDEIDTGLDSNGLKLVVDIINNRKNEKLSTIVITHNISTVQNLDYDYGLMFEKNKLIQVDNNTVEQKLKDGYD